MSEAGPYAVLREHIVSGELAPGETLSEVALAERLSVSRTPIREALRRLEQDGLVRRAGRRLVVRRRTPEEVAEMYEVREVLEACAARAAARRATGLDVARIEAAEERLRAGVAEDVSPVGMARLTHEFHREIWVGAHNEALLETLDRLATTMFGNPGTAIMREARADMLAEHRSLVEAIRAHDPQAAWDVATAHQAAARRRELDELVGREHP